MRIWTIAAFLTPLCMISLSVADTRPRMDVVPEDDPALEWLPLDPKLDRAWTPTQMDSLINANMSTYNIPGVVALVTKDNEVVWKGEYGWANVGRGIAASDTTLFLLASISKTFVGNAAMQLWQSGSLDLDIDINTYLPFSVQNPFFPDSTITMRMLLTHTSTIAREDSVWVNRVTLGADSPTPLGDYLEDYLDPGGALYDSANYLDYAPGTHYEYSNNAYALAGYLVQLIAGVSLEQYCQDSLFAPLGMNETSWFLANLDTNNIAMPYAPSGAPYGQYGFAIYPCGQLRTSASQLVRHMFAFMNYGELDGARILDSATVVAMRTWQYPEVYAGLGLGWIEAIGDSWDVWGHSGTLFGCRTQMWFDPADRTGVVLLANGESGSVTILQALWAFSADRDLDGIVAGLDNCPDTYNPGQGDQDNDGMGDACDVCAVTMTGDVNMNGSITSADIIAMVNYIFKSGAPPQPCMAAADVNCSGTTTSADIIATVNYVFKGGDEPCNVCQMVPVPWGDCP